MVGYDIFDKLKARFKGEGAFKILFCPYKEDMFDSMETIWEAAVKDRETYTEIMPIPYFTLVDVLPHSTRMEFKDYQGNFPEILNEGWDVIIIHYPYDTKNNVTRPMLTSAMLKFFTKHLVHINYAVIGDRDIEPKEGAFPAYKNCDLIICERKKHAEQLSGYMRMLNIHTECVAWGSPKFDKLDIDYPLPYAWQRKVRGKKKILLQTSLTPYLNTPNKLEQIKHFLDKYWDDESVCIWWRPHPLLADTILAHKPEDYNAFMELISTVEMSRHILDLTSNMRRAIAMTDELVSDRSSMVVLYESTGKPIRMLGEE